MLIADSYVAALGPTTTVSFFRCPAKYRRLWARLINRKDVNQLSDHQKVCGNHFILGRPSDLHPHPELYIKGYNTSASHELL